MNRILKAEMIEKEIHSLSFENFDKLYSNITLKAEWRKRIRQLKSEIPFPGEGPLDRYLT